jgi:hypothetical protein
MTVTKLRATVLVSDEDIVDFGWGTPEDQAAAAERIEVRKRETHARWMALPFWVRAYRRLRWHLAERITRD